MLVNGSLVRKKVKENKKRRYMILICNKLIFNRIIHCEVSYIGNKLRRDQNLGQISFTSHWPHYENSSFRGFIRRTKKIEKFTKKLNPMHILYLYMQLDHK